jgi:hypothetical protein
MASMIDAIYFDPADKQWKSVTDPEVLKWLDSQLQSGQMSIATDWQYRV